MNSESYCVTDPLRPPARLADADDRLPQLVLVGPVSIQAELDAGGVGVRDDGDPDAAGTDVQTADGVLEEGQLAPEVRRLDSVRSVDQKDDVSRRRRQGARTDLATDSGMTFNEYPRQAASR